MADKNIRVTLTLKDDGTLVLNKFTKKTEKSLKKVRKSATDTQKVFKKVTAQMKLMTAAAIAFGIAASIAIGKSSIQAASDLQEAAGKFSVVFKGLETEAEHASQVLVDAYGLSERAAKEYMSAVGDILKPLGLSTQAALKMSTAATKLAVDIGSFSNKETANVIRDISTALTGEYQVMKKYGVVLNEAVIKQEAMNTGLMKTGDTLTANIKAQAAYSAIVRMSADAIGDFNRTRANYANQQKILEANIERFQALLGSKLLPKVNEMITAFNVWATKSGNLSAAVDLLVVSLKALGAIIAVITTVALVGFGAAAVSSLVATAKFTKGIFKLTKGVGGLTRLFLTLEAPLLAYQNRTGLIAIAMRGLNKVLAVTMWLLNHPALLAAAAVILAIAYAVSVFRDRQRELNIDLATANKLEKERSLELANKRLTALNEYIEQYKKLVALGYTLTEFQKKELAYYNKLKGETEKRIADTKASMNPKAGADTTTPEGKAKAEAAKAKAKQNADEKKKLELEAQMYIWDLKKTAAERAIIELDREHAHFVAKYGESMVVYEAYMTKRRLIQEAEQQFMNKLRAEGILAEKEAAEQKLRDYIERSNREIEVEKAAAKKKADAIKAEAQKMEDMWVGVANNVKDTFASGFTDVIMGTKNMKDALLEMGEQVAKMLINLAIKMAIVKAFGGSGLSFSGGGISPKAPPGAANGAVFNGPTSGYLATLHGNEAVIPLKGGSVPVDIQGGGSKNFNISVNVDGSKGGTREENSRLGKQLGKEIKDEVKKILIDERRFGGINGQQASARAF